MTTADTAELLRLFFIQQQSVNLPGIGRFKLNRVPARVNHTSGSIDAPSYTIDFDHNNDIPSKDLFAYVSWKKNISEWEAIGVVNNFAMSLKEQLKKGQRFEWAGIGSLENNLSGHLIFEPVNIRYDFQPQVLPGLHYNSTGYDSNNADQQGAIFEGEEEYVVEDRTSWWVAAAVIAAVGLGIILVSMISSEYKLSGARGTKIVPSSTPSQYEYKPAY